MALPESKLEEIRKAFASNFGPNLAGLILYGSALGGDFNPGRSDLNVLVVLQRLDPGHEAFSRRGFQEWLRANRVSPLYMDPEEVRASQDVFPMEYLDMQRRRKVLEGRDFLAGLVIEPAYLRHQIEYELRGGLWALRGALAGGDEPPEQALNRALTSVLILLKSLLFLEQQDVPEAPGEVITAACALAGLDAARPAAANDWRLRRDGSKTSGPEVRRLAAGLHAWMAELIKFVDSYWEKEKARAAVPGR